MSETIPIRRYLGLAIALFYWTPAEFWASTPYEFFAAIDARLEIMNGTDPEDEYAEWFDTIPDEHKV